eukprot:6349080-Prymnesium_polylepis.2
MRPNCWDLFGTRAMGGASPGESWCGDRGGVGGVGDPSDGWVLLGRIARGQSDLPCLGFGWIDGGADTDPPSASGHSVSDLRLSGKTGEW